VAPDGRTRRMALSKAEVHVRFSDRDAGAGAASRLRAGADY
jgi:hypothetical protein